ncbi:YqgE/AlgH family protein [Pedobacter sp. AW31-3R]|uniref:YqgE/AlgH family protein n=1 Tax=Pedobacter sp. AW31-3R TaxID=3445781 RepID=UPI003F9FDF9F
MLNRLMPSAGKLLISEPFMKDPNFTRSVVLLTAHGEEGTMGFVINQPGNLLLKDLVPEFTNADFPVYYGGPVGNDTLHFIHRCYDRMNDGEEIARGIYWGGNFETLRILMNEGAIAPDEIKFFVGYSGWEEKQLEEEMEVNTWIVSDQFHPDTIFSNSEEQMWRDVIVNLGPKFAHVSKFPQNPNLN